MAEMSGRDSTIPVRPLALGKVCTSSNVAFAAVGSRVVPGDTVGSTVLNGPSAAAFGRDGAREMKILYVTTRAGQIVAVDTSGGHA
jgi:hypothetical protein